MGVSPFWTGLGTPEERIGLALKPPQDPVHQAGGPGLAEPPGCLHRLSDRGMRCYARVEQLVEPCHQERL